MSAIYRATVRVIDAEAFARELRSGGPKLELPDIAGCVSDDMRAALEPVAAGRTVKDLLGSSETRAPATEALLAGLVPVLSRRGMTFGQTAFVGFFSCGRRARADGGPEVARGAAGGEIDLERMRLAQHLRRAMTQEMTDLLLSKGRLEVYLREAERALGMTEVIRADETAALESFLARERDRDGLLRRIETGGAGDDAARGEAPEKLASEKKAGAPRRRAEVERRLVAAKTEAEIAKIETERSIARGSIEHSADREESMRARDLARRAAETEITRESARAGPRADALVREALAEAERWPRRTGALHLNVKTDLGLSRGALDSYVPGPGATVPEGRACPKCSGPVGSEMAFCPDCGAKLAAAPPPAEKVTDSVRFSVAAPAMMKRGGAYLVEVWAYLAAQFEEVLEHARRAQGGQEPRVSTRAGVRVERGVLLTVTLHVEGLRVSDPSDTMVWLGEIANAQFPVAVPGDARVGTYPGSARIHAAGMQMARLHFALEVGTHEAPPDTRPARDIRCRSAFASYASADREAVLARVQGLQKAAPALDVFLDVVSLRSGQEWEVRLKEEIAQRDIFYLFWSENARRSRWVETEWRCALATRGLDFIDPVPLASPEDVPPPPELAGKHFNDWVLAFMRSRGS